MKPLVGLAVCLLVSSANAADTVSTETIAMWDKHCASCHAKDGSGDTKMGKKANVKDYRDPKVQSEMKDDKAVSVIKEGLKENGMVRMKPFADKLTDAEIKTLIAYMRTFKKAN